MTSIEKEDFAGYTLIIGLFKLKCLSFSIWSCFTKNSIYRSILHGDKTSNYKCKNRSFAFI